MIITFMPATGNEKANLVVLIMNGNDRIMVILTAIYRGCFSILNFFFTNTVSLVSLTLMFHIVCYILFNIRVRGLVIYVGILGNFESAPGILTSTAPIGDNICAHDEAHANSGSLVMVVSPAYISIFISHCSNP